MCWNVRAKQWGLSHGAAREKKRLSGAKAVLNPEFVSYSIAENWWFGACWWFGIRASDTPIRNITIPFHKGILFESQSTGPRTNNWPSVELVDLNKKRLRGVDFYWKVQRCRSRCGKQVPQGPGRHRSSVLQKLTHQLRCFLFFLGGGGPPLFCWWWDTSFSVGGASQNTGPCFLMKQRQGWQWSVLDLDKKGEVESNQCESAKSWYIHGRRNMAYWLSKEEMQKKETSGSWNPPLFAMMIGMMSGEKEDSRQNY